MPKFNSTRCVKIIQVSPWTYHRSRWSYGINNGANKALSNVTRNRCSASVRAISCRSRHSPKRIVWWNHRGTVVEQKKMIPVSPLRRDLYRKCEHVKKGFRCQLKCFSPIILNIVVRKTPCVNTKKSTSVSKGK